MGEKPEKRCTCCEKFIPELTLESTWIVFGIKLVLIIILAGILLLFENYLDQRIFDSSRITFAAMGIVIIFNLVVGFLIVVYIPYMWHISPFWYSIVITVVYIFLTFLFAILGLVLDRLPNVDEPALDLWTIVHTLAGVFFGFVLPFVPMCFVVSIWEVLEADWTEGLGDGESVSNHVVDVVVAVIGWFFTVILCLYVFPRFNCKQTTLNCLGLEDESTKQCLLPWQQVFHRMPWISARAASSERVYWDFNWGFGDNNNSKIVEMNGRSNDAAPNDQEVI